MRLELPRPAASVSPVMAPRAAQVEGKPLRMAATHPPRTIILADGSRPEMRDAFERLRPIIERHLPVAAVSFDFASDLTGIDAELAIVIGGDGSILRAAHQMG